MSLAKELQERGFIHQISGPSLEEIVDGEKRIIYTGIDPSSDSAQAGNMVIWMMLRHLAQAGHKIIFLIGGGTGMIGDPKPDTERELKDSSIVVANVVKIKAQAEKFFAGYEIEFVNNIDWLGELKLIDFLRDIGKHYTVNDLIKKDAISTRLQSDTGLSYTEFAYPILQGFDFYELFKTKGCNVQVGGSDQWGNIVSGVELVRRKSQAEVFAVTVPLIIDKSTGRKFGKSEGNTVWLDTEKTSPYQFYQFWLNVSDDSVVDYLKLFTFLPLSEIEQIARDFEVNPGARLAQKTLAYSVTEIVHGAAAVISSQEVSEILFGDKTIENISDTSKNILLQNAPTSKAEMGSMIIDLLVSTNLATSKREARTFIESGAVSINGAKVETVEETLLEENLVSGLAILRRGKKQLHVLSV